MPTCTLSSTQMSTKRGTLHRHAVDCLNHSAAAELSCGCLILQVKGKANLGGCVGVGGIELTRDTNECLGLERLHGYQHTIT